MSLSFLLLCGVAEIAARVIRSGQQGGKEGREDEAYKEYDPLLGWRKRKNAIATYKRREYTVEVRINSQGLRDPERLPASDPNAFRVLALGDSFVEGYTVDLEQTVTQRLESRLKAAGCATEVINGGTSAYSTDQELLFYRSDGARYRPSLVLLFFFWNDVIYSDRQDYFGTPKPVFEMGKGGLTLHRYPVREKPKDVSLEKDPEESVPEGSALVDLIRERLWLGAPAMHDRIARLGFWNPIPKTPPRLEMLVYDRRDLAVIEDAWEKVGAILAALKRSVLEHGSKLAIVYVPGLMEIQEASFKATEQLYRLREGAWDPAKVARKVRAFGDALGIPVLDLRPALKAATGPLQPTYFSFDVHWNARGHDTASEAIAAWMKSTGSLSRACGGSLPAQAETDAVWDPATGPFPR
jgi:lysophospholipase L1-like esterase